MGVKDDTSCGWPECPHFGIVVVNGRWYCHEHWREARMPELDGQESLFDEGGES